MSIFLLYIGSATYQVLSAIGRIYQEIHSAFVPGESIYHIGNLLYERVDSRRALISHIKVLVI